jgi:hypothetical protein
VAGCARARAQEFKAQTIDTPGVIERVSRLFHGSRDLILGFNTFLPPGYNIDFVNNQVQVQHTPQPGQLGGPPLPQPAARGYGGGMAQGGYGGAPGGQWAGGAHGGGGGDGGYGGGRGALGGAGGNGPAGGNGAGAGAAGGGKKQIEFDQAINYVTKIKLRFAKQPETYKHFLDILHRYQKEHRTIKEVYEQARSRAHPRATACDRTRALCGAAECALTTIKFNLNCALTVCARGADAHATRARCALRACLAPHPSLLPLCAACPSPLSLSRARKSFLPPPLFNFDVD